MTQKTREDYENILDEIVQSSRHTIQDKQLAFQGIIIEVLLDIREKLFNPDMKESGSPLKRPSQKESITPVNDLSNDPYNPPK